MYSAVQLMKSTGRYSPYLATEAIARFWGRVGDNTLRLQKRRYSRSDFTGHFYARFEPESGSTGIDGYFDAPRSARYFMRIWLGMAVLLGAPIFVETVMDITNWKPSHERRQMGRTSGATLVFFGTVAPRLGRLLGKKDERFILEHVQTTLAARVEE
jgi:hypothetical protein